MDVSARGRLGRVEVAVGIEPEHPARPMQRGEGADRPDRDRVVASEHERRQAVLGRRAHLPGDPLARLPDLGEEPGIRVAGIRRLADLRVDVAPVVAGNAQRGKPLPESRVPDRRRSHVDPAAPCAEIELGADDRHTVPVGHPAILTKETRAPID